MTDPEFVKDLVKDLKYLESLIKKLEERIIVLETRDSVVKIIPSDSYYWEESAVAQTTCE